MRTSVYKVLLVEDQRLYREAFMRFVESRQLPYDCTEACSVAEAKDVLALTRFDVVVADYSLGDGTAADVLEIVRDTPVIIITGAGDEEIAVKAWKAGAYDYMVKDFDRNYLKAIPITIENAIRHRRAEKQTRLLLGAIMSTADSIYITDMEDKIVFVNSAFCETYGYTEEEILGKNTEVLWGEIPPDVNWDLVHKAFDGGEIRTYHIRKDGSEFPVSLTVSVIESEGSSYIGRVSVARDMSERLYMEEMIRSINVKLGIGNHPTY